MASTSVDDSRKRKLKSPVWDYCTPNEAHTQAVCNICSKKFKLVKSCTSGLSQHLSSAHQIHVEGGGGKRCTYFDPNTTTTCMICEDVCDEGIPTKKALPWEETYNLDSQLSVILLVRKILNVPKDAVETVLRTKGDPSTWGLKMCGPCRRIFTEAEFLNSRINQLSKEFSDLSNLLRTQVKNTDWLTERTTPLNTSEEQEQVEFTRENDADKIQSLRKGRRGRGRKRKRVQGVRPKAQTEDDKMSSENGDVQQILFARSNNNQEVAGSSGSTQEVSKKTFVEFSKVGKLEHEDTDRSNTSTIIQEEDSLPDSFGIDNDENGSGGEDDFLNDGADDDSDYVADEEEEVYERSTRRRRSSSKSRGLQEQTKRINAFEVPQPIKVDEEYQCPISPCSRKLPSKCAAHAHILRIHYKDESPFHCHLCPSAYNRENPLRKHLKIIHNGARTPLDEPDEEFALDLIDELGLKYSTLAGNESRKFTCDQCPKRKTPQLYKSPETLEAHKKMVHLGIERPYECKLCGKAFKQEFLFHQHLFVHKRKQHKTGRFCTQCNREFTNLLALKRHLKKSNHTSQFPFSCSICGEGFTVETDLETHKLEKHVKHETGVSESTNEAEEEEGEVQENAVCAECGHTFKSAAILKRHLGTKGHCPAFSYRCQQCSKGFPQKGLLLEHQAQEHDGFPFSCNICGQGFLLHRVLQAHKSEKHPKIKPTKDKKAAAEEEKAVCVECDLEFKNEAAFKKHLLQAKKHCQEVPFTCELCSKGFMQKRSLLNHQSQEHYKELRIEPFKCNYCEQVLSSSRALDHHIRIIHTKDTTFRCEECNAGFMVLKTYNNHLRAIHGKERPFLCTQCPKRFSMKVRLTEHMRVHSGEKPYKCAHCGREFADKPTFRRHLETHGEQVHVCTICQKQFKVWHTYRLHMRAAHKRVIYKRPPPPSFKFRKTKSPSAGTTTEEVKNDLPESSGANNMTAAGVMPDSNPAQEEEIDMPILQAITEEPVNTTVDSSCPAFIRNDLA